MNGSAQGLLLLISLQFDAQMKRMGDIQEIIERLKEKHSNDKYTPEQLHCWANLIQMKKHASYESPPEYRYFNSKVWW